MVGLFKDVNEFSGENASQYDNARRLPLAQMMESYSWFAQNYTKIYPRTTSGCRDNSSSAMYALCQVVLGCQTVGCGWCVCRDVVNILLYQL